jgi:hypothetical protein
MIAGKDGDHDVIEPGYLAPLPMREPYRQVFEAAEASRRFCQDLLPLGRSFGRAGIAAGQVATEGAYIV